MKEWKMSAASALRCLIILSVITVIGCSSKRKVDWVHIIPNDYTGWVAIQYNCPGGVPLNQYNGTIIITYNSDGLFCTSSSYFPSRGDIIAQNHLGVPIRYLSVWQVGYGVCCGSISRVNNITEEGIELDIVINRLWVGDKDGYPELRMGDFDPAKGPLKPSEW
jgi:hypothetical protein